MQVRGQLAKADLQRDEGGSRSPAPPEQSCGSQTSGPGSAAQANAPVPQCLWEASSWDHVDGGACASDCTPERTLHGPGATSCRNKAGLSLRRTCPTRHQGPSSCVPSSPTWGHRPQQPLGWEEDCASLLLGSGEENGERTRTSRPAESEVRGWCPRERGNVCIGVLAA